jgi:hypothetical protein
MENISYVHFIIAPKLNSFIVPVILIIVFIASIVCFIGIMYYMKNTSIVITDEYLKIKSFLYSRTVPLDKINVNGLRQLNLYDDQEYNIKIRTNGIAVPNYYAGWMKLNNGNKAFVHITDKTNVVLIPSDGYDILFSTDDFDGIKEMLNKRE